MSYNIRQHANHLILLLVLFSSLALSACGSAGGSDPEITDSTDTRDTTGGTTLPEETIATLSVNLSWDASPDESVVGYKVYYNTENTSFPEGVLGANEGTSPLDVGAQTMSTLSGLLENETHYFAVTAYDEYGNESIFSNIVSTQ